MEQLMMTQQHQAAAAAVAGAVAGGVAGAVAGAEATRCVCRQYLPSGQGGWGGKSRAAVPVSSNARGNGSRVQIKDPACTGCSLLLPAYHTHTQLQKMTAHLILRLLLLTLVLCHTCCCCFAAVAMHVQHTSPSTSNSRHIHQVTVPQLVAGQKRAAAADVVGKPPKKASAARAPAATGEDADDWDENAVAAALGLSGIDWMLQDEGVGAADGSAAPGSSRGGGRGGGRGRRGGKTSGAQSNSKASKVGVQALMVVEMGVCLRGEERSGMLSMASQRIME